MSYKDKLKKKDGPRKLLACDGGGIRGIISIEILAKIEAELRASSKRPKLVLADYFDYVAGTSTGAIIATLIALGKTVDQIREFYIKSGGGDVRKSAVVGEVQNQIPQRQAFRHAAEDHRRGHPVRVREARDSLDGGAAQCHHRFALAALE
jgi:patatin-like phospholipase/acyl hydrolase